MGLTSRSRESYWVNKGAYTDTHPWSKDPCRPFRAPYWCYNIILNSEMNFYLLYNMCASVHADFCRPTGLEYARPGLAPTHCGTTKVAINYWCIEKLSTILSVEKQSDSYTIRVGSTECIECIHIVEARHIGAIALALILILTIDRLCRQCSRSSICQSPWSASMNSVNNWIQSNVTSKVRMGLTSWPRRRTRFGRSCSQLISWQQLQYVQIETNFNSKVF